MHSLDFSGHLIIWENESNSVLISAIVRKCPDGALRCIVVAKTVGYMQLNCVILFRDLRFNMITSDLFRESNFFSR